MNEAEQFRLIQEVTSLRAALLRIRAFSSAIERGEEPWREGVQEITRIALAAVLPAIPVKTEKKP